MDPLPLIRHPALQPPAPAVQRQADAAGDAARGRPGRLHGGDRRAPIRRMYQTGVGIFTPGTPLATDAGLGPLTGPRSIDRAKALMQEAGYTNQPMRLIGPTDILAPAALTQVGADMFRRLGVNARLRADRLGHRGAAAHVSREPVERAAGACCSPPSPPSTSSTRPAISRCAATAPAPGRAGRPSRGSRNCATPGSTRRTCRPQQAWRGRCRRWRWTNCPTSRSAPTCRSPPRGGT